jgi:hypothetical protein
VPIQLWNLKHRTCKHVPVAQHFPQSARAGSAIAQGTSGASDRERVRFFDDLHGLPIQKSPIFGPPAAIGRLPDPINVLLTLSAKQLLTTF